jgi:hypothetical protein
MVFLFPDLRRRGRFWQLAIEEIFADRTAFLAEEEPHASAFPFIFGWSIHGDDLNPHNGA